MSSKILKIGIIGSGGRGGHLAAIINQMRSRAKVRITACCDTKPATLEKNRTDFGREIFATSDYRKLLQQDLDAVIIGTPDFLHEEQAVAALSRGLAVYLEKPMAITIAGCDRILATAAKSGARLYVGHNMRHMPFVQKMKELIDGGAIGEVKACWVRHFVGHGGDFYFHDWHAERRYSTGLLLQKAAHDIDIIHWLCGGYTRQVSGMGALTLYGNIKDRLPATRTPRAKTSYERTCWPPTQASKLNHRIDVEDLSSMQMLLDNGVQAVYMQCHYTPDYWRNYTFIGTEGRLENFGDGGSDTLIRVWNTRRVDYDASGSRVYRVRPPGAGGHGGSDPRIIAEFLHYAREGGPTATSPLAARESVATGCRATESLRTGGGLLPVPRLPARLARHFSGKA